MTTVRFKDGSYQMWDEVTEGYWPVSKEEALDALSNADKLVFNSWQNDTLETINKFRDISSMLPVPFLEVKAHRRVGKTTLIKTLTAHDNSHLVIGKNTRKEHSNTNYLNAVSLGGSANKDLLYCFTNVEEVWLDDVELTDSQLEFIRLVVKPKSIIQIYTPKD